MPRKEWHVQVYEYRATDPALLRQKVDEIHGARQHMIMMQTTSEQARKRYPFLFGDEWIAFQRDPQGTLDTKYDGNWRRLGQRLTRLVRLIETYEGPPIALLDAKVVVYRLLQRHLAKLGHVGPKLERLTALVKDVQRWRPDRNVRAVRAANNQLRRWGIGPYISHETVVEHPEVARTVPLEIDVEGDLERLSIRKYKQWQTIESILAARSVDCQSNLGWNTQAHGGKFRCKT